jgi:hypothetical protein
MSAGYRFHQFPGATGCLLFPLFFILNLSEPSKKGLLRTTQKWNHTISETIEISTANF